MEHSSTKKINLPLTVIAVVALGFALIAMKGIIMPLVVAFFLVCLSGPSFNLMRKVGIPQAVSVVIIIILAGFIVFLIGKSLTAHVPEFQRRAPDYKQRLIEISIDIKENYLPERFKEYIDVEESIKAIPVKHMIQTAASQLGNLFTIIGTSLLVLIYMVFLLMEREQILYRLKEAGGKNKDRILLIFDNIQKQTESYLIGKAVVSLLTALLVTIILWLFEVEYFVLWGIMTCLLNFVPNIGSVIATIFPIMMAIVQVDDGALTQTANEPAAQIETVDQIESASIDQDKSKVSDQAKGESLIPNESAPVAKTNNKEAFFSFTQIAILGILLILIQMGVGSFLEPRVIGDRLNLSPFVIFFSFILWGWLWGIPGMMLSVPIMATLRIIFENIDALKPVAVMVSNTKAKVSKPVGE